MSIRISSLQNDRVKNVVKLRQRRNRDAQRQTVVEGEREIRRALQSGLVPQEAFFCPALQEESEDIVAQWQSLAQSGSLQLFQVTPPVFAKMAYRGGSGGLLMVVPYLQRALETLPLQEAPFLAVVDGVEKPGNLGAILRSADGAGVDGVIVSDDGASTDVHNPNVIRASLGALFAVPVARAKGEQIVAWLRRRDVQIVAATPDAAQSYTAVDLTGPVAIVGGSEAQGVSDLWREHADRRVAIPMAGVADSLNLSIAMALLLYEVVRQRQAPVPGLRG